MPCVVTCATHSLFSFSRLNGQYSHWASDLTKGRGKVSDRNLSLTSRLSSARSFGATMKFYPRLIGLIGMLVAPPVLAGRPR
jgi:hypothetical protein